MEKIYSLRNRFLLFFVLLYHVAFAQTNVITGQINDEKNLPLPSAIVMLKGTTLKTATDVNGYFKLTGVPAGPQTLVVSYIGYNSFEKTVNGTSTVNLQLVPSSQNLNDVAVIGYGTIRKSDATGALSVITAKDFNKGAVNSIQDAVLGR
jgi:hypothetical protein